MAITDFKVIEATDAADMLAQAATAIAAGWQPTGSAFQRLSKDYPGNAAMLCQAFIKGLPASMSAVANAGVAASGVTALEYGDGRTHQTVLTIASVLPAIAGGAALGVGKLLYTFPAGEQIIESAYMSVGITQTEAHINANTPKVGLGSVIASGVVSVLNGTATFMDIITEQTAANCTGTPTVKTAKATSSPFEFITAALGAKTVHFNAAVSWAASGDAAAILAGTVVLNWRTMA